MRLIPLALIAAAAVWLATQWEKLPDRWIVHWGPGGVPNGYATRSVGGVFGPLLLAALLAVFLEVLAMILERISRARFPLLARAYGNFVRWLSMALVGSISVVAIVLPTQTPSSPQPMVGLLLGTVGLALAAGVVGLVAATWRMRAAGQSLPKGYSALFYRNADDPRIFVPKLVGVGWTLNFAHPSAWLVLALLLLPALVGLVAVLVATG
jgi:uncharacterized membrane protein